MEIRREEIELTPREFSDWHDIRPLPGEAFSFWRRIADDRGLDPATVFSSDGTVRKVSALPKGHGKHWCWPSPLICKRRPQS